MPVLLALCFIISGATSLILQVVWVRDLALVFGSSTLAISTVLATFMAGLALGSSLGGRLADHIGTKRNRAAHPACDGADYPIPPWHKGIFYYGCCELIVAASALAVPILLDSYRPINAALWRALGDTPALLAASRFGLSAIVLLIPTTAMGATLPLLGRYILQIDRDFQGLSRHLGRLYSANTIGAVSGAALAGFVFLPRLGGDATNLIAAITAAALGVAVIGACFRRTTARPSALASEVTDDPSMTPPMSHHRRLALITYAIAGATAMALEVLWSRALAVVIGSSVYSFTLILVVFLFGISFGSFAISRRAATTRTPVSLLSSVFIATAIAVLITHLIIDDLPAVFLALIEGGQMTPNTIMGIHAILAGIAILPGALGLGAIMPVSMRVYLGSMESVGSDIGRAYAANTLGAIAGSIAGAVLILPTVGVEFGVLLCAATFAVVSIALAIGGEDSRRRVAIRIATATMALAFAATTPRWNLSDFTAGLFRTHLARHYIGEGSIRQRNLVYYGDGIATTVSVETRDGRWILKNNGKTEASNRTDMPTQILVGLLPILFHGGSDIDVFVIGYGSGVTIGAIEQSPAVTEIEVAELEPKVLDAADRHFGPFNNRAHESDKLVRHIGDGRDVLLAGGKKYDVIVSEPSNPWMAGVSTLFTREFYRFAKAHLEPDGVFCQWAQLYELGPRNVKLIYATFAEAFPYVYAFTPGDGTSDTILLGSLRPLPFDLEALARAMRAPDVKAELRRADIEAAEELVASFMLGPDDIASFTAGADINTDDNGILEFAAPLDLLRENRARLAREIRTMGWPYGRLGNILTETATRNATLARALIGYGRYREAAVWNARARTYGDERAEDIALLLDLAAPVDYLDPELAITAGGATLPSLDTNPVGTEAKRDIAAIKRAYHHLSEGEWAPAWRAIDDLHPDTETTHGRDIELVRGYLAYKALDLRTARRILRRLATDEFHRRRPSALYYLARVELGLGNFTKGRDLMESFVERHRDLARESASSRLR